MTTAQPLINELTAALTTASNSLSAMQTGGLLKRGDDIALANLVAELIIVSFFCLLYSMRFFTFNTHKGYH